MLKSHNGSGSGAGSGSDFDKDGLPSPDIKLGSSSTPDSGMFLKDRSDSNNTSSNPSKRRTFQGLSRTKIFTGTEIGNDGKAQFNIPQNMSFGGQNALNNIIQVQAKMT